MDIQTKKGYDNLFKLSNSHKFHPLLRMDFQESTAASLTTGSCQPLLMLTLPKGLAGHTNEKKRRSSILHRRLIDQKKIVIRKTSIEAKFPRLLEQY